MAPAVGQTSLLCFFISAPGREPNPNSSTELTGRGHQGINTLREAGIELPERISIVPAIVQKKGVQLHSALADQFAAERVDRVQDISRTVAIAVTNVIPAVVMEKWLIRTGALPLQIGEETAPHLSRL